MNKNPKIKVGQRYELICIKTDGYSMISVGQTYQGRQYYENLSGIEMLLNGLTEIQIGDKKYALPSHLFISVADHRENVIDEIL